MSLLRKAAPPHTHRSHQSGCGGDLKAFPKLRLDAQHQLTFHWNKEPLTTCSLNSKLLCPTGKA